jgi:hypothetical protein
MLGKRIGENLGIKKSNAVENVIEFEATFTKAQEKVWRIPTEMSTEFDQHTKTFGYKYQTQKLLLKSFITNELMVMLLKSLSNGVNQSKNLLILREQKGVLKKPDKGDTHKRMMQQLIKVFF